MIRQIAPLFFTIDIPGTLAYYKDKLGFDCQGTCTIRRFTRLWRATNMRFTFAALSAYGQS